MTPTGILESALYAGDLDAAEVFYRDVLGLECISGSATAMCSSAAGTGCC
jgi:catechol 2,3-dioxygenase-like lactoylglutathione lyase family enzyme